MKTPEGFSVRSVAGGEDMRRRGRNERSHARGERGARGRGNYVARAWQWMMLQQRTLGWPRILGRAAGVTGLVLFLYLGYLWFTLPDINNPAEFFPAQSTAITDRNGIELYRLYSEQDRTYIPDERIADHVKNAVVAIEDSRFYTRSCLDVRALARAVFRFGSKGGASTLTRQLARNALNLQKENFLNRKLKELILGCQMESRFSKAQVLEMYLNWVPFGNNAYGVEQASRKYFDKSAKDLTLAESAVLASVPQLPSYYSPYGKHVRTTVPADIRAAIAEGDITSTEQIGNDDVSIGLIGVTVGSGSQAIYVGGRTDQVLQNMENQGYIEEEERLKALADLQKIQFKQTRENIRAPHFVLWMKEQTERMFAAEPALLEQGGFAIQTTLDWRLQEAAQDVVAAHSEDIKNRFGANNIALVAMDPRTREVLAYVGNVNYSDDVKDGKIDMAQVPRAPGSSFKPFAYAAAFEAGYSPATVLYDVKTRFGADEPQNYEGGFQGLMNARQALGASRNIPAIKAFFLAGGEDPVLQLATRMGAPTPEAYRRKRKEQSPSFDYGWPLALGAGETPLLEMTQGYATFADGGQVKPVTTIRKITDRTGVLHYEADSNRASGEALDPRIAYQITSILSDPSVRPGDYWRNILTVPGTQAAAKTGTSNKPCPEDERKKGTCRIKPDNVWTMGYSPSLVVGVWVGNATSEAMSERADGITVAAPIWKEFMTRAHKLLQENAPAPLPTTFTMPDGIVQPQISLLSGELPTECTPVEMRKADVFLSNRAPSKPDPACVRLTVDKVTGLLASDSCPAEAREERSFLLPHSILPARWPQWEQGVQEWVRSKAGSGSGLPLPFAPTEACDISLTPGRTEQPTLEIVSPSPGGSATYPSFQPRIRYTVGSRVREVSYAIDGRIIGTIVSAPFDPPLRVPRSISENGTHVLRVTLTDEYYNTVVSSVSFGFRQDAGGPQLMFVSPADGSTFAAGENVTMRVDASDTEGGIKYVEFFLDDVLLTRKPREPYELIYPIAAPGTHRLKAIATDLAGNTATDEIEIEVAADGNVVVGE